MGHYSELIMYIQLNLADATRLNDVLMKYVTGVYQSPIAFDAEQTTTYIDVNAYYYFWDWLMEYARNDTNLQYMDKETINFAYSQYSDYVPMEPIGI